ncbi:hypothetical protein IFM89_014175 [Coptis chinensis]|uniref:PH domain-containing protein n=1 Tax=Coptis chinensis TaxID=261450 RepID=A0A835IC02_9MAGN|nr:hypothetical protein IFM89_014175 [Coptis chinensis]
MRVKEMHPLCCITLESNQSPRISPPTRSEGNAVNNNVAGVLYKWTNFSKGWRSRWFLVKNGVVSYSKIPRSENFDSDVRVIGDDVRLTRVCSSSRRRKQEQHNKSSVGFVHLKISSFRESKSDDRRFYIFTATKTLHLRTDSKKDRVAWIQALVSTRNLFSLSPLNDDKLSLIPNDISISTEKLRKRLLEEGISEVLVMDCEQIVLSEFSELQGQLKVLCEERSNLLDTLRQLEAANTEVEASGINENQFQLTKQEYTSSGRGKFSECSTTESSDDIERQELEESSDEDKASFFDTNEYFTDSSANCGSIIGVTHHVNNCIEAEDHIDTAEKMHFESELSNSRYPHIERRKKLPDPMEKEKGVSLWSMIKDNVGKDLTQGNSLLRILNVAAFAVSGYASSEGRHCKPFNPLLGETYEADYPDKGIRFFSEKVSHHPTLIACHCEGRGWKFSGDSNLRTKFWGRSIQLDPVGVLTLEFDDGEVFQWNKVTTAIYNLILGKIYCDHHGTMHIRGNRQHSCKLKFKEQSILERNPHQVQGSVEDAMGNKVASLFGKWNDSMYYTKGDGSARNKNSNPLTNAELLWKRNKPPPNLTRYNLTSFAITLNELTAGLQEKLPPTDSRLRPDQRHLENGEYEKANAEKLRLEMRQRMALLQHLCCDIRALSKFCQGNCRKMDGSQDGLRRIPTMDHSDTLVGTGRQESVENGMNAHKFLVNSCRKCM